MTELYIDFQENYQLSPVKKLIFIGFGVLLILLSFFVFLSNPFQNLTFRSLVSPVCDFIIGLSFILKSIRFTILKTTNFIKITEDEIDYKFWRFQKTVKISWIDISKIQMMPDKIKFFTSKQGNVTLTLSFLSLDAANKIKPVIHTIAVKKNIPVIK
jgi:hypothetical protein